MGNRVKVPIGAIGTYHLILHIEHHLDIFQTLYVLSISRNLVSLSKLDTTRYFFKFGKGFFNFFKHNNFIGISVRCDGLYKLNLDNLCVQTLLTLHHNLGIKHGLVDESSTYGINAWVTYPRKKT